MFKGSFPALVTPFRNGELDLDTLEKLVEWHIGEGSHGLVPVGTTGESPTLSHREHETVVTEVVRAAAGRIPVIAGTGSNNTVEAIRFMRHAESVGADAALVVTPYYNKPTQAGMIAHFTALHDCCELPIIIYNIPGRSAVDMTPETMGELAQLPRIIGVKDATCDLARVCAQRITCGKDFIQISGEDPIAHSFNAAGGVGVISVTANVAPRLVAQVQEATLAGDFATALESAGQADAPAPRDLHRTGARGRQIRDVTAGALQRRGPHAAGRSQRSDQGAGRARAASRGAARLAVGM